MAQRASWRRLARRDDAQDEQDEERDRQQGHRDGRGVDRPVDLDLLGDVLRRDLGLVRDAAADSGRPQPNSARWRARTRAARRRAAPGRAPQDTRRKIVQLPARAMAAACSASRSDLIGGGIPHKTEVASQYIAKQIEIDRPVNAAAVSMTLLAISFLVLLVLRVVATRRPPPRGPLSHGADTPDPPVAAPRRARYLVALLLVPLTMIFYRTFEDGLAAFWAQVTTRRASPRSNCRSRSWRSSCR